MILGEVCTRRCTFCAIPRGAPSSVEADEPDRIAEAARRMRLEHIVITSVARDDLEDQGSIQFEKVIQTLRRELPGLTIEVLTPDFHGNIEAIQRVVEAGPDIFNHNLETVERLQKRLRPYARYERSLEVIQTVKRLKRNLWTKSGLMVGVGETEEEVVQTMRDLRKADCDMLTIGQYLQSDLHNLPVAEFVHPDRFKAYETRAYTFGFSYVFSGPFVRSSYLAELGKEKILSHFSEKE